MESVQARTPSPVSDGSVDSTSRTEDSSWTNEEAFNSSQKSFQHVESHDMLGSDPLDTATGGDSDLEGDKCESLLQSPSTTKKNLYTCNLCDRVFTSSGNLNSHIQVHSAGKPFSCPICHKGFAEKKTLEAHKYLHTGKKPFQCPVCGREYLTKKSMTLHHRLHSEGKSHICEVCGKGFAYNYLMNLHKRVHTGEKPYACEFCDKAFTRSGKLRSHLRTHTDKRPFRCRLCLQGFTCGSKLTAHMQLHFGENKHFCEICCKTLPTEFSLRIHVMSHSGVKIYACNVCEKEFPTKWKLRSHSRVHTGEIPFVCPYCNKKYIDKNYAKKHLRKHEENNDVLASHHKRREKVCGKNNDSVVRDMENEPEVECFEEERSLKGHSETGETMSEIDGANSETEGSNMNLGTVSKQEEKTAEFSKSSSTEIPVSTGGVFVEENVELQSQHCKKFGCHCCGKTFVRQANLKAHMTVHVGEKIFSCNLCHKTFTLSDRLKRHMRVHNEVKSHVCRQCGKKYATKRSLLDHVLRHEEEEEEEEEVEVGKFPEDFRTSADFVEVIIKEEVDIEEDGTEDPFSEVTVKMEDDEYIQRVPD
ncbi:zinc finger protein 595-like [Macrobrachium nipponense]|uniref:zinc finger protein 595-like n=1 Tax=Macrobrachium nipponense TaxID=159736 RepID=UPI0030C7AB59